MTLFFRENAGNPKKETKGIKSCIADKWPGHAGKAEAEQDAAAKHSEQNVQNDGGYKKGGHFNASGER